jgi:hypothetical protein
MQKPNLPQAIWQRLTARLVWFVAAIQIASLFGFSPVAAQEQPGGGNTSTPNQLGLPASLELSSGRLVLEAPYNSSSPDLSTADLTATVRDIAGNLVKGAVVVFGSGDEAIRDISGSIEGVSTTVTNSVGIATTSYKTGSSTAEDIVRIWAYAVVDPKASAYSDSNLISRDLQLTINNVEDHSNPGIDAVAGAQAQLDERTQDQPERTTADLMSEVEGSNSIKVEMDAILGADDNLQEPPYEWVAIGVDIRAAASRAIGGDQTPPNLGQTSINYWLEFSDQNDTAANLKSISGPASLHFTQTKTSTQGNDSSGANTITYGSDDSTQNILYLNPRAWGQRTVQIHVQLISKNSPNRAQLAEQFSSIDDRTIILAEQTLSFTQTNQDQPVLKAEFTAKPETAKPGERVVVVEGLFTANDEPVEGEVTITAKSSDDKLGRLDGNSINVQSGKFKFSYYPVYDELEREITFAVHGQVKDGQGEAIAEEFGTLDTNFILKQLADKPEEAQSDPNRADDTRILLGTNDSKNGRYTMNVYGNRQTVITSRYFEGRNTFSLGAGDRGARGTRISELSIINGYPDATASYMIMEIEVIDHLRQDRKVITDPINCFPEGRLPGSLEQYLTDLTAAENGPTEFFLANVPTSQNLLSGRLDDGSAKATFYYVPGDLKLKSGQTLSRNIACSFGSTNQVIVPISIISRDDYDGDDKKQEIAVAVTPLESAAPAPVVADASTDKSWTTIGRHLNVRFSPPSGSGTSTGTIVASTASKWYVDKQSPALESKAAHLPVNFTAQANVPIDIYLNSAKLPVDIDITIKQANGPSFTKHISITASGDSTGDGGDENGDDESGAGDGTGDSGDGSGDEDGESSGSEDGSEDTPPVQKGPINQSYTDNWLKIGFNIRANSNLLAPGEVQELPVTIDIPADVRYSRTDKDALNRPHIFFNARVFHLDGDGEVSFKQSDWNAKKVERQVITDKSRWGSQIGGAWVGPGFFDVRVSSATHRIVLGSFTLKKGSSKIDSLGVQVLYNTPSSNRTTVQKDNILSTFSGNSLATTTLVALGAKVGLNTEDAPVQDPGSDSTQSQADTDNCGYETKYFECDLTRPLTPVNLQKESDDAYAAFSLSSSLTEDKKLILRGNLDRLVASPTPSNVVNIGSGGLGYIIDNNGGGDRSALHQTAIKFLASVINFHIQNNKANFSTNQAKMFDQAAQEIKSGNINVLEDIYGAGDSVRNAASGLIDYATNRMGWKRPVTSTNPLFNLFGAGSSFASTTPDSDATGPVSFLNIFSDWLVNLLNVR